MLLGAVFFLSGAAALLYQVVWQRALFAIYGVNIESVTVIVTAFMLGLGLGSLAGGALSKRAERLLAWFALVELGLGLFGLASMPLFQWVGALTLRLSPAATALVTFALVLAPTMLMGATLPLLVAHGVRRSGNVGVSVGTLYSVNTLGSAIASIAAVLLLLGRLGQVGATWLAAALNFTVSAIVYAQHRRCARS
jgi:predicted membrane-bound spermidine synthase